MGEYAVVARRSASNWYIGILNAGNKRRVILPLDMLKDLSTYKATLYYQAPGKKKNQATLTLDVEANSGCVLHFSKEG